MKRKKPAEKKDKFQLYLAALNSIIELEKKFYPKKFCSKLKIDFKTYCNIMSKKKSKKNKEETEKSKEESKEIFLNASLKKPGNPIQAQHLNTVKDLVAKVTDKPTLFKAYVDLLEKKQELKCLLEFESKPIYRFEDFQLLGIPKCFNDDNWDKNTYVKHSDLHVVFYTYLLMETLIEPPYFTADLASQILRLKKRMSEKITKNKDDKPEVRSIKDQMNANFNKERSHLESLIVDTLNNDTSAFKVFDLQNKASRTVNISLPRYFYDIVVRDRIPIPQHNMGRIFAASLAIEDIVNNKFQWPSKNTIVLFEKVILLSEEVQELQKQIAQRQAARHSLKFLLFSNQSQETSTHPLGQLPPNILKRVINSGNSIFSDNVPAPKKQKTNPDEVKKTTDFLNLSEVERMNAILSSMR